MRLNDKVALVTGAASGIGKEIAITFFREGATRVLPTNPQAQQQRQNNLIDLEISSVRTTLWLPPETALSATRHRRY